METIAHFYNFSKNKNIDINILKICEFTGLKLEQNEIITILKNLGFAIEQINSENFKLTVPKRRPDISSWQDVSEEILRIIGIARVESRPFVFSEKRRDNKTSNRFKTKSLIRNRAMALGFRRRLFIYLVKNRNLKNMALKR